MRFRCFSVQIVVLAWILFLMSFSVESQAKAAEASNKAEWYFSWGYSTESWANTDIHVSQPSLGNSFTIHNVRGTDDAQSPFSGSLFGPQYNVRIGRFINQAHTIALELSLDHTRYKTTLNQVAQVTGTIDGVPVNGNYVLDQNTFSEVLHNGANHLMANVVYRHPLIGRLNETLSLAGIAKIGAGVMLPHTTDTVLGNTNDVGSKSWGNLVGVNSGWWQLNGWTAGVEGGFRFVLYKPVYLELTDKVAYSYLYNLPAYQGTISQSMLMNEVIMSLGFTF